MMTHRGSLEKTFLTFKWFLQLLRHPYFLKHAFKSKKEATRDLFILGNGRSVDLLTSELIRKSHDFLVVNRFVDHPDFTLIKPEYYVIADPYFLYSAEGKEYLNKINDSVNWDMKFIVPSWSRVYKSIYHIFRENQNISIERVNVAPYYGFQWIRKWLYRSNLSCPLSMNVVVLGIYFGLISGYRSIKLIGVEHSWIPNLKVNMDNEVCLKNEHFYTKKASYKTWEELFDEKKSMAEVLIMYAQMFHSYEELEALSVGFGARIINHSTESYIDSFTKKPL